MSLLWDKVSVLCSRLAAWEFGEVSYLVAGILGLWMKYTTPSFMEIPTRVLTFKASVQYIEPFSLLCVYSARLHVCIHVCILPHVFSALGAQKSALDGSSGTRVIDCWDPPCGYFEPNPESLQEQEVLLTVERPHQQHAHGFHYNLVTIVPESLGNESFS